MASSVRAPAISSLPSVDVGVGHFAFAEIFVLVVFDHCAFFLGFAAATAARAAPFRALATLGVFAFLLVVLPLTRIRWRPDLPFVGARRVGFEFFEAKKTNRNTRSNDTFSSAVFGNTIDNASFRNARSR